MNVDCTVDSSHAGQPKRFAGRLLPVGLFAIAVLLVHGWSLGDGLSLDDYWHFHHLRNAEPSIDSLFSTTTIDADELAHHWWRDLPVRFKYARPLSVAVMWSSYVIGGWNPAAVHFVSLILHWVSAVFVWRIGLRFDLGRCAALWAALFFLCLPLSVFAVAWPAAQNMLLMTSLMLAAVLAYMNATNWHCDESTDTTLPFDTRTGWMILAYGLWLAALVSRENAVVLPVILLSLDWAAGGWRAVRSRLRWHILWFATAATYAGWRVGFYAVAMPDGYVRRFGDDGFLPWCVAKLIFYWACSVWPAPMVVGPSGRYHPFADAPLDFAMMAAIVLITTAVYALLARRTRGWWIWPLWIVLATLPVTTVMATPHSGYLCGVATAIGAAIGVSRLSKQAGSAGRTTISVVMVVVLIGSAGICKLHRLMWRGMHYAESFVFTGLAADPPANDAYVFMIDLPFAATYARVWMTESLQRDIPPDHFHVLTYAPNIVRADAACTIEQAGPSTLRIRTEGPGWFSGFLGQFLIDGMRESGGFKSGETIATDEFTATVREMSADGVTEIEFAFAQRLDDPGYAFYLTSEQHGALRLRFGATSTGENGLTPSPDREVTLRELEQVMRALRHGDSAAADILFAGARSPDSAVRAEALMMLRETVAVIAEATGSPVQHLFDREAMTDDDIGQIQSWWRTAGIDRDLLDRVFTDRARLMDIRERRDELARGRRLIGRMIQSDLYLTGPPFPGPRSLDRSDRSD